MGSLRKAPPRQLKEQQVEPGYDVLLQFRMSVAEDTRRPPRAELVQAFRDLFGYKYQYGKRVNATQAQWMCKLFEYLCGDGAEEGWGASGPAVRDLTGQDIRTAREALAIRPTLTEAAGGVADRPDDYQKLARLLYGELQRRGTANAVDFKQHIGLLCQYGAAVEASELLAQYFSAGAGSSQSRRDKELWMLVLAGLAREGREEALLREAAAAEAGGLAYMPLFHEIMTTFYARQRRRRPRGQQAEVLAQTRAWFEKPMTTESGTGPRLLATARTYRELLAFGQPTSEGGSAERQQWVEGVFQQLCDANPPKDRWDVIFQWAVVARGRGVDEVRRMLETMARHNGGRPSMRADVATINGLVAAAAARGDVLLAERFVQLGADLQIAPDAQTHTLQLDYRVAAGDLSGAHASFLALQGEIVGRRENEEAEAEADVDHAAAVNRYLRALCSQASSQETHAQFVLRLRDAVDAVERLQLALEPTTVVALCMAFLRHDRQYDVIDVLAVHALQYSVDERAVVREAFVAYIADRRQSSTARAWDAYSLLRQFFAETPTASRLRLMDGFFRRRRPDMACLVFGHTRATSSAPALRPDAAAYVRCLEGLARCPDPASLHMVHNMLKMDPRVQPSTRLYTALMLAYAGCDDRPRALEFWHDLDASPEGPSYASLAAVFWVCESLPFGDEPARAVWAKIQRMEIDVPPAVYDAYCAALAGQGHVEESQRLIDGMVKSTGYGPTATTLGLAYNALPGQTLQTDFAHWAATEYPDLWQQTTKSGCRSNADGLRRYNIVRELRA